MDWLGKRQEQSRLGQILLNKKLISEEQLAQAIAAQRSTGQRLGEVLAAMQLVSEAQLRGAIRRQRNLRMAGALAAALLGPLQAAAGTAAAAVPVPARSAPERPMRALSDGELREVAGQGGDGDEALRAQTRQAERLLAQLQPLLAHGEKHKQDEGGPALRVLGDIAALFNPLSLLLGADVSIRDVVYDPEHARAVVNKDGSVTFYLPSSIGEISLTNIRVGQSHEGPSFGSLQIRDIDLKGTSITVRKL
jgi:hypothetical protein